MLNDEFFEAGQLFRGGIAGYDDGDAGALAVHEPGADVGVLVVAKVDGSGGVEGGFAATDADKDVVRGGVVKEEPGRLESS
jgi:hypothetical protein